MLRTIWRWTRKLYLPAVVIWTALWQGLGDRGLLGLINAWAFWLLAPPLAMAAARLGSRRHAQTRAATFGWLAAGFVLLAQRYRWLLLVQPTAPARRPRAPRRREALRVMSFNVLKENQDAAAVLRAIEREAPDVVLVQELEPEMSEQLHEALERYDHCHWHAHHRSGGGLGFFSRVPFEITGLWDQPATRPFAIRISLDLPEGPVDLYNVHLQSIAAKSIRKTGLAGNFRVRELQVDTIAAEMRGRARPALAMGDYNMTEGNDAYRRAAAQMQDAWLVAGRGPGWTWPRRDFPPRRPVLRLDYCFCSPEIRPVAMWVAQQWTGSDHCPIVVDAAPDGRG